MLAVMTMNLTTHEICFCMLFVALFVFTSGAMLRQELSTPGRELANQTRWQSSTGGAHSSGIDVTQVPPLQATPRHYRRGAGNAAPPRPAAQCRLSVLDSTPRDLQVGGARHNTRGASNSRSRCPGARPRTVTPRGSAKGPRAKENLLPPPWMRSRGRRVH